MRSTMLAAAIGVTALLAGCASPRVTPLFATSEPAPVVHVIAFAPGGGLLADAVGLELSNRGYTVLDASTTTAMMARLSVNEVQITQADGLSKMKGQGVDAMLTVKAVGGPDGKPQSASARMTSTETGRVFAGCNWQNGWGGAPGSLADHLSRDDLNDAAATIATALVGQPKAK